MSRTDSEVIKLLKDIEGKPENAAKILEIARKNPWDLVFICKAVFHHGNFDTPKKCGIMEDLVYRILLRGIDDANINVLYSASGCMLPFEIKGQNQKYKKVKSEEKIMMHTNRTFTMIKAFEKLEKDSMYLFGAPDSAHVDTVGQIYMRKLRERIAMLHKHAGLNVPLAFKKRQIPKKEITRGREKRLAA